MDTPSHEDLDGDLDGDLEQGLDGGLEEGRAQRREAYDSSTLRDADFETMSGHRPRARVRPRGSAPGPGARATGLAGSPPRHPGSLRLGVPLEAVDDAHVRRVRHHHDLSVTLAAVAAHAVTTEVDLMPAIPDAVRASATVGRIVGAPGSVFGRRAGNPVV
jgi:hypothetical protein